MGGAARQILPEKYRKQDQDTPPDGNWRDKQVEGYARPDLSFKLVSGDTERIKNGGGAFAATRSLLTTRLKC